MATNVIKAKYAIHVDGRTGCWAGRCPTCSERFVASAIEVSQLGVIVAIQRHEAEAHAPPPPMGEELDPDLVCECEHFADDHEDMTGACQHDGAFPRTRCSCPSFRLAVNA